jgi:membrane protein
MPPRPLDQRIENAVTWLAAAALTAVAVIYAVKRDEDRQKQHDTFISGLTPATEPLSLQVARASEPGRGRQADSPLEIPWAGWKDIFWRTYQQIQDDRLLALAAGVVFYALVALFPAIAAGVSFYALFANAATIANHL